MAPGDGNGDRLTRWRRRTRARLLRLAPLNAWRALLGVGVLLAAAGLREAGMIQDRGFQVLLAIGLSLFGFQLAATANGKRNGRNGKPPEGK